MCNSKKDRANPFSIFRLYTYSVTRKSYGYNVSFKAHYAGNWLYYPTDFFSASNSDYTILTFGLSERESTDSFPQLGDITAGGQVDFRVEALIGYYTQVDNPLSQFIGASYHYEFTGQTSDWSNTQTITISEGSISTSTSPNPTSSSNPTTSPTSSATELTDNSITVPLSTLIAVVAVFLAIIVAFSLLLFRKHRKAISQNKPNV